jgi:hypothetical protein
MTNGRVNPQFTLDDQGITGLGTVYYNLLEPTLIEQALARKEGQLGKGGAFLGFYRKIHWPISKRQTCGQNRLLWPIAFGGKIMPQCLKQVLKRSMKI